MSLGDKICEYISLRPDTIPQVIAEVVDIVLFETSQSSTNNRKGYHSSDVGRSGSRSQETIHSSYRNQGTIVYVEGRGGYRSHTSHSSFHNPGECVKLLALPISSCCVKKKVHER